MDDQALHILVVDDDSTGLLLLEESLEAVQPSRFVLTGAKRLDEALRGLHDKRFDAVLLHLGLPDSQGLETFVRMQHEHPAIPILILSGVNDEALAIQAVQGGAQDLVAKGNLKGILLARSIRYAIERKRSEQRLVASEAGYRRLFETAHDGIFILDAGTGQITDANPYLEELLGYTITEFIGKRLWEIAPFRDKVANQAAFRTLQEKGYIRYDDLPLVTKEGKRANVEFISNVYAVGSQQVIQCNIRDITERKQQEAALLKAHGDLENRVEERTAELKIANGELRTEFAERKQAVEAQQESYALLQAVTEGTTDCIFVKDLQGRYLMINSAGARRRGKTVAEILGKVDTDLFSPATAHIIMEADHRILAADAMQTFEEITVEDGATRTHLVTKAPHRNPRGEVIGIVGIARDITAQKQLEVSLRMAKEEADSANAAKSEFLSRMSHELRTPLNAILGFGQILDKQDLAPLSRESVGYILKGGRHLLDLINEVLDIARVEAGHMDLSLEPIALDDVVPEACALVRPLAAERHIRLGENTSELGRNYILADHQRLKQVLINLLSNAIKYNREGGQVEVTCDHKPDGWTTIAIRDTGPGISPQNLLKLFTPFERLSASASGIEGTGLGLVLSQRLVTAMGGTLKVASTLGQGTTFTIELPQTTSPVELLANLPEDLHHLASSKETERTYSVLCIEDNPSNLRLLEVIFEMRPEITLLAAIQGSVGLDLARQHEPDLILLDLNLPDISGKEVLARLQQSALTRDIPVVVISADATPNQVERLLAAGARAYLTKPLNVAEFLQTLDKFLQVTPAIATPPSNDKEVV